MSTLFTSLFLTELFFYSSVQLVFKNIVKFKTKFETVDHIQVVRGFKIAQQTVYIHSLHLKLSQHSKMYERNQCNIN